MVGAAGEKCIEVKLLRNDDRSGVIFRCVMDPDGVAHDGSSIFAAPDRTRWRSIPTARGAWCSRSGRRARWCGYDMATHLPHIPGPISDTTAKRMASCHRMQGAARTGPHRFRLTGSAPAPPFRRNHSLWAPAAPETIRWPRKPVAWTRRGTCRTGKPICHAAGHGPERGLRSLSPCPGQSRNRDRSFRWR